MNDYVLSDSYFVGIDPGASGAIAVIDSDGRLRDSIAFDKMRYPTVSNAIRSIVLSWPHGIRLVSLEKVSSMPKQGVASSFKFGASYGYIQGVLDTLDINYILIRPQEWQKTILKGLNRGDKNITKDYCRRKYGIDNVKATPRSTTPHSGICDAICLAEYARAQL